MGSITIQGDDEQAYCEEFLQAHVFISILYF